MITAQFIVDALKASRGVIRALYGPDDREFIDETELYSLSGWEDVTDPSDPEDITWEFRTASWGGIRFLFEEGEVSWEGCG